MSIGVAIVGSGIFIREEHLPAIAINPAFTLKAIYSRSLASAQALNQNVPLYSNDSGVGFTYYDLLLREDIQAVIIALPINAQPEYIEAALQAGKHVLSEKPIAADLVHAERLMQYYKSDKVQSGVTWSVAENYRFRNSFAFGQSQVARLGRVLGFHVKSFDNVVAGNKYLETAWRKRPEYQGGFLLDAGVHFVAAMRLLLGEAAKPVAVTGYTTLLREHLPPVDTVDSVWLIESGVSGTFAVSFGSTLSGSEYTVACENGSVTVLKGKVIVREGVEGLGNSMEVEFKDEGNEVVQEVAAWAQSIITGMLNPLQAPEQALADLEIMEKLLRSGEEQGQSKRLQYQI